jgi:uncharacterized protein
MSTDEKPSRNEDEYFAKQNLELLREHRARLDRERAKSEQAQQTLKCPKCGSALVEQEHHHVKIDVCPTCRGVWLDAGELEQLERAGAGGGVTKIFGSLFGQRP